MIPFPVVLKLVYVFVHCWQFKLLLTYLYKYLSFLLQGSNVAYGIDLKCIELKFNCYQIQSPDNMIDR